MDILDRAADLYPDKEAPVERKIDRAMINSGNLSTSPTASYLGFSIACRHGCLSLTTISEAEGLIYVISFGLCD